MKGTGIMRITTGTTVMTAITRSYFTTNRSSKLRTSGAKEAAGKPGFRCPAPKGRLISNNMIGTTSVVPLGRLDLPAL